MTLCVCVCVTQNKVWSSQRLELKFEEVTTQRSGLKSRFRPFQLREDASSDQFFCSFSVSQKSPPSVAYVVSGKEKDAVKFLFFFL